MAALVTVQMLDLHKRLATEGVPHDPEGSRLQRWIEMTDRHTEGGRVGV